MKTTVDGKAYSNLAEIIFFFFFTKSARKGSKNSQYSEISVFDFDYAFMQKHLLSLNIICYKLATGIFYMAINSTLKIELG